MPLLKVPPADAALKPFVGQYVVTVRDCTIVVSHAYEFTRNRGLVFVGIVAIGAREGVSGLSGDYTNRQFIRQTSDVLAARPTFADAVAAAYGFFEATPDMPDMANGSLSALDSGTQS